MEKPPQSALESVFETILFNFRLIVLLAVLGSLVASLLMFVRGALQIVDAGISFVEHPMPGHGEGGHTGMAITLISSVDSFLFATVLLIFAMGIYELFISKIDPASRTPESRPNWLAIYSLDDLKSAIGKVILMILIVRLFEIAVEMHYEHPIDLLWLALSVICVSGALYLVHAQHKTAHDPLAAPADSVAGGPHSH
jgi:uncharacterized membrane protein YqhA